MCENLIWGDHVLNKITGVTRRDIFDLFKNGIKEDNWLIPEAIVYPYYGRLDIVEFLKRLYNLGLGK